MNVGALAPVGYTGFRWAMQIDPIWNAAYLSWVLSIADQIETDLPLKFHPVAIRVSADVTPFGAG